MSGPTQPPADQATAGQNRQPAAQVRRWLLIGSWAIVSFLLLTFVAALIASLAPSFSNNLPGILALIASQPLTIRLPIYAWLLLAPFFGWVLWRANKRARAAIEQEETKARLKEPPGEVANEAKATHQEHEELNRHVEGTDRALPPGVVAPQVLRRAATLVGRDAELDDLMAKLRAGTTMGIFALRGMGGVGKTALAAEAVARLASEPQTFPGGAAWISCESLTGAEGLAELWARVARALGLEQVAAQPDPQVRRAALAQALMQRERLLLALDNIEPDLDAGAALDTLAVAGHTALLLTAHQPVAPQRLESIEIKPLDLPPAGELFRQRLCQVDAARPTPQDEAALPRLLEALGGLPLALELTAAYAGVQHLPLGDVLHEVESDGLNAPALRGDPQRALNKRFDRSWQKLTARQQRLFAGLALLEGANFPRAAALALAQATLAKAASDAAGDLTTLVDYALVEALEGGRLCLHPLLRKFAAERLATLPQAQRERLGDAMVAFWLAYVEAHPGYEGMDALEAEAAGLMGALTWAHEYARQREVLVLANAIRQFWFVRGRVVDARRGRSWAVEAAQALGDRQEEQSAIHGLTVLDSQQGRLTEARAGYERALALAQQLGDPAAEQREVHNLAVLDAQTGRHSEAQAGFERALALAQQLGDPAAERAEVHGLAVLDDQEEHSLKRGQAMSGRWPWRSS